jgi:hypothetical protein
MAEKEPGEMDQAAAGQDLGGTGQAATGQEGAGEMDQAAAETKMVPLAALEAERKKRQEAEQRGEQEVQNLRQQFELLRQSQVQDMPKRAQDYFAAQGLEDDDIPTVKQLRGYAQEVQQQGNVQQHVSAIQHFIDSKPDYTEKVGIVNVVGQFTPSATLLRAMQDDPTLARDYQTGSMTPQSAYRAVKGYEARCELTELKSKAKRDEAEHNVDLKTRPGSPVAAGGGGRINTSINAGANPNTPEGRAAIKANFARALEGDFDKD